jgi:hypothetical protein
MYQMLVQSDVYDKITQFHLILIYRENERVRDCVQPGLWIAHDKYDKMLWAVFATTLWEGGRVAYAF